MYFKNRRDAGQKLAKLLENYKNEGVVVYALPRGGVAVADEIAKALHAPLDLVLAHKIGHPNYSEYAVAAVSESGLMAASSRELPYISESWLENAKEKEMQEIKRKRRVYLKDKKEPSVENKVAIIVDDGIATGLTMQVGILELRKKKPKKIVVAVPVAPKRTAEALLSTADDFVGLIIPEDHKFLGGVAAYYQKFDQVEDDEVIAILNPRE